ncbi:carbonic anhydrase [Streptomyces sp. NPDC058953]|uniref:carbonic anhydrase n=1 Tax=unclassified Streptomyces TaxID=2593676 RepID=UPI00368BD381
MANPVANGSRRGVLRGLVAGGVVAGTGLTLGGAGPAAAAPGARPLGVQNFVTPANPTDAETALFAGNLRWVNQQQTHPREDAARRAVVAGGQAPWAAVVSCIDSRLPPELIFDQGLGDLFTTRVAGPVIDYAVLGSTAFAASKSSVKLIVVLGHERCGAVEYAIGRKDNDPAYPPPYSDRLEFLSARIHAAIPPVGTPDRVNATIDENVRRIKSQLLQEPDIAPRVTAGTINVIGARYDLDTWAVTKVV